MEEIKMYAIRCQPLYEAVSWNNSETELWPGAYGQPLYEAVSWNVNPIFKKFISFVSLFMRLWVEICPDVNIRLYRNVSLFMRLWVEINHDHECLWIGRSASLWGCELKCWRIESTIFCVPSASLWGCELKYVKTSDIPVVVGSASLWGCELKYVCRQVGLTSEDVSLFMRLWVEI